MTFRYESKDLVRMVRDQSDENISPDYKGQKKRDVSVMSRMCSDPKTIKGLLTHNPL